MLEVEIRNLIALARRSELTEQTWFELLEQRRSIVKDYLRDMTLKSIEDVRFLDDDSGAQSIRSRSPIRFWIGHLGDIRFTQETRGLFPNDKTSGGIATIEYHPTSKNELDKRTDERPSTPSTHRFWGLTRNNEWIGIEVEVIMEYEGHNRVVKPECLTVNEYPVEELCLFAQRTPRQLWLRLGEAVRQWAEHRKILYESSRLRAERFAMEEEILAAAFPV